MNTSCFSHRRDRTAGFTLIELMLATGLALMLLVGLVKIIAMVNTSFARTRVIIDLQNRCRSTQILLQQDLAHLTVTPKAPRPVGMDDGYLSLGKITNANIYRENSKLTRNDGSEKVDTNLQDSCCFAAFTIFNRDNSFTFMDPSNTSRMLQTPTAEVLWFVYKNDLYRIAVPYVNSPEEACSYFAQNGGTSRVAGSNAYGTGNGRIPYVRMISSGALGDFTNRILNYGKSYGNYVWDEVPNVISYEQLQNYMVLPNVIMFKVQIYNPDKDRYYDLENIGNGDNSYYDYHAFTYPNGGTGTHSATVYYDSGSTLSFLPSTEVTAEALHTRDGAVAVDENMFRPDAGNASYQVPTTSFLPGMRILVRAFDPDSGTIREFRVGKEFRTR